MNKLKYIELQVKFAIQLKTFFEQDIELYEKNYFYYVFPHGILLLNLKIESR